MSTGGATMPRRMFTMRSVPPPRSWLPGCAARASTTSSSVRGRTSATVRRTDLVPKSITGAIQVAAVRLDLLEVLNARVRSGDFLNEATEQYPTVAAAKAAGAVTINYGLFINSIIKFVIVAFAVFLLVKQINRLKLDLATEPGNVTLNVAAAGKTGKVGVEI